MCVTRRESSKQLLLYERGVREQCGACCVRRLLVDGATRFLPAASAILAKQT